MAPRPAATATDESSDAEREDRTNDEPDPSVRIAVTGLATYGLAAAILAVAANALVRVVALSLLGVPDTFEPLDWAPVINTTVVGVVGATVVYGALTRVSTRPDRTFFVLATGVLLLSFAPIVWPPSFLDGAPASVLVTLGVMHVTTAAIAVGVLVRGARSRRASR